MKKIYIYLFFIISIFSNAHAFDTLFIDSIGLKNTIFEYKNIKQMHTGLMYDTLSAKAGTNGNIVVLGHRYSDKYGRKPNTFVDLPKVNVGDVIKITKDNGDEISYKIFDTFVVSPYDDWVTYDYEDQLDTLTLYTCAPLWNNSFRFVVKAKKITNLATSTNSTSTISLISGMNDGDIRGSIIYSHKDSHKKAIFNESTGVEPKAIYVRKGESYEVIEANKKKYKSKIYKNEEIGEFEIKGPRGAMLKVVVE